MKQITLLIVACAFLSLSAVAQTPAPTVLPTPDAPSIPSPVNPVRTIDAGTLSARDVAGLEAALQKNPKDLQSRKTIIEYYSRHEEKDPAAKKSLHKHRLLLIRYFPAEHHFSDLGYWDAESAKNNTEFLELKNEYLRQVEVSKDNSDVRMRAVRFLEDADPEATEKILREGVALDLSNDLLFEKLIEFYAARLEKMETLFDEGDKTIPESAIDGMRTKMIADGERKLEAWAKAEGMKDSDERLELLRKVAAAALELNDVKKARLHAEAILRDFITAEPDASQNRAIFYGNNLMGRVRLREGDINQAKVHLAKSVALYIGDDGEIPEAELDLAGELLMRGEKQAVLDYLQKIEGLSTDQNVRKAYRNWQRKLKRNLAPF